MNTATDNARRMITEEIPVAGNELLSRVKALLSEGRVRHIKVKSPTGETYFEVPLAVGVLGGAALAWASPFLAMAGALAGMVTSVKLEVVRDADAADAMEAGAKMVAGKAAGAIAATKQAAGKARKTATSAAKSAAASTKKVAAKAPKAAKAPAKAVAKTVKKAAAKVVRKTKAAGHR
jgi:hypothetical protein